MDETPQPVGKWGYIDAISKLSKTPCGETLLALMDQYGKSSTTAITLDEAKTFYEQITQGGESSDAVYGRQKPHCP